MKNKTLSLFLSLSVSLSSIWRNLKNSKRKSRKKEGKEKRNPERPEFYISQRTLFPPRKKNCTLSTVRASHISTPILYANPNPNLTRPTQRIVWQRRVPSQTRGISLFQNSSRPPFPPDKWSDYRFAYTHAHASIWKIRNSLVKRRNESIGLGNKSRGEE